VPRISVVQPDLEPPHADLEAALHKLQISWSMERRAEVRRHEHFEPKRVRLLKKSLRARRRLSKSQRRPWSRD
jgi:ribosomal protein S21